MDNQKIYEALRTIKDLCQENGCISCPLSVGKNPYKCKICDNEYKCDYPRDWKLEKPTNYKAFEE